MKLLTINQHSILGKEEGVCRLQGIQRIESTYIFVSLVRFMLLHLKAVSAPTKSPSMWAGAAVPRVSCWVSTRQWPGSGFRYLELHARLALGPARRVYNHGYHCHACRHGERDLHQDHFPLTHNWGIFEEESSYFVIVNCSLYIHSCCYSMS